jgi:hypothetical protein
MKSDKEILNELINKFPIGIESKYPFPKPYPEKVNPEKVKAIYLGCDPTNSHTDELSHVFALVNTPQVFKGFVTTHTNQLKAIGLNWNDVYVQNLCRNYFLKETGKNLRIWNKVAKEYWIDKLRNELNELKIPKSTPVLLTSMYLYQVLVTDDTWARFKSPEIYLEEKIPVPANANKLNRPLIPVYRGRSPRLETNYNLATNEKWEGYRNKVINILNQK